MKGSEQYRIYPAIRRGFCPSRMTSNNQVSPMKFCYNTNFNFLNNPKDLDPSYKMDLDLRDCFRREKTLSYNRRNTVLYQYNSKHKFAVASIQERLYTRVIQILIIQIL